MFALKSHGLRFLALVFRMSAREKKKEKKKTKNRGKRKDSRAERKKRTKGKFNGVRTVGNLPDVELPTCFQPSLSLIKPSQPSFQPCFKPLTYL